MLFIASRLRGGLVLGECSLGELSRDDPGLGGLFWGIATNNWSVSKHLALFGEAWKRTDNIVGMCGRK